MSPITDDRALPLASVRLYHPGQGDPFLVDRGFRWYQPVAGIWEGGSITYTTSGEPKVEHLEGIGIVCRPSLALQDTRTADYTFHSTSDWDERMPATGSPRKYRLVQSNASADLQWHATSRFALPGDPHIAFSLVAPPSPPDHDATTYPPYGRLELGDGQWALQWSRAFGSALMLKVSGSWRIVAELEPLQPVDQEMGEPLVMIRPMRGAIGISMDRGRTYRWYRGSDGRGASIRAGKITLRGQGGQVIFGLHQLAYATGSYTSPERTTLTSRSIAATPAITFRGLAPTNTVLSVVDASTPAQGLAAWTATLQPGTLLGPPGWSCHTTPELYAVQLVYPVIRSGGSGAYSTPYDDAIEDIEIDRPFELAEAHCRIRIRRPADLSFSYRHGRWPRVDVWLGHTLDGGGTEWTLAFSGYLERLRSMQSEYGRAEVELSLTGPAIRFQRTTWVEIESIPLGGRTLNQALDLVLDTEGLSGWHRSWHWAGNYIVLPGGSPEDPSFWPQPGESKWDTMEQLCRWAGMELGVTTTGQLATVPRDYVEPWVTRKWEWANYASIHEVALSADYELDCAGSVTGVLRRGTDEYGIPIWAYMIDAAAEWLPSSDRFCPWRELDQETIRTATSPGWLALAAQSDFLDLATPRQELELTTPVQLGLRRRQQVRLVGAPIGVWTSDRFMITALRHSYRKATPVAGLTTTVTMRRIA